MPSPGMRQQIIGLMTDLYASASWELPEDFLEFSHFRRALLELDLTSSPGFPYCARNPTNRVLFHVSDMNVWDEGRVSYMWEIVQGKLRGEGPDPIRVFVKPEPHKVSKLEGGRFRLISSVSVADQLVDHMLFDEMNKTLLQTWPEHPSKPGWSHLQGGWRMIPRETGMATDKSGWDWTCHLWLFEMILQVRAELCRTRGPKFDRWIELATMRYKQLFLEPELITSGGTILRQLRPGVMKSGCVNTISDNSMGQVILHLRVCLEIGVDVGWLFAMGDDVLQQQVPELRPYLDRLAMFCKVKAAQCVNEFAGFRFHGRRVEPLYKGKHAFNLLHMNPKFMEEMVESYLLLYHRSSYRDWMRQLFISMGAEVKPLWWFDNIVDGL